MSLASKIQNLINAGNEVTGNEDTNLTDVMQALIDGYADDRTPAFIADFSGNTPLSSQFYSWEGRDFGAVTDSMANITCSDGVVDLVTRYDSTRSKWIRQMLSTGGLFESDNFTLTFKAMFDGTAGSWQNVITYGTGTHWTNGTYSDGIKWPAGGEIDAFEQAGGYRANPNTFSPVFHYGAGSNSNYPNTHLFSSIASGLSLPVDEWADYRFNLQDGVAKIYVNGALVAQGDGSDLVVNNNYLWDYKPFLKPQAFYIDGQCASSSASIDTNNVYHFYVKDFEIFTESRHNTECTGLSVYPQMWQSGTTLVFPTNAEFYLDRVYTPANTSNKACTWESSNPSIATVCQGYVKTLSEGSCTISATCGSITATYALTVSNSSANVPCAGVVIDSETLQIVGTGSTDIASIVYKYPSFTTDSIVLSSSDTNVATVSGTTVTGVGTGSATITVTCGNGSATIPVVVSSGLIFEADIPTLTNGIQTLSSDAITYDPTKTYSIQYTFGAITPTVTVTTPNCTVGPATASGAVRAGAVQYIGSASTWQVQLGPAAQDIAPSDGDKVTFVINFATGKQSVYLNNTAVVTNREIQLVYYNTTAKLIAGRQNANMTVAPTHIKIAIGDLH